MHAKRTLPKKGFTHNRKEPFFSSPSSGVELMSFGSGRMWNMPDAILYYILDCGYMPPKEFVEDVMHGHRERIGQGLRIVSMGYHTQGEKSSGPGDFFSRLAALRPDKTMHPIGWLDFTHNKPFPEGVEDIDVVCKGWNHPTVTLRDFVDKLLSISPNLAKKTEGVDMEEVFSAIEAGRSR